MTHTPSGYHLHLTLRFQDEWILTAGGAQEFQRLSCEVIDRFFGRKAEVIYQFPTGGYSGCYVLAESHYNYHTYPEHKLAAVDIYYCSDGVDPDDVVEAIRECFGCQVEGKIERRDDDRRGLTSLILAEVTGKTHKSVLRNIRNELSRLQDLGTKESLRVLSGFDKSFRKDSKGESRPYYKLTSEAFLYLASGYSYSARCKIACLLSDLDTGNLGLCGYPIKDSLPETSSVYIIKELKTSRRKVGISKDPEERLKCLQIGNSHRLDLEYCSKPAANAREIELYLHKTFQEFSVGGEWFNSQLPIQEVIQMIRTRTEEESPDEL